MPISPEEMLPPNQQLAMLIWKLQIRNIDAAAYTGVHERTFYKWLAGERKVPKTALKLFELMLKVKEGKL